MSTSITQVQNTSTIRDAEFIRLDVEGAADTPYFFSSSFRNETITDPLTGTTSTATVTFIGLGGLLSVTGHQRDLSVTSFDTSVTLVGVDKTKVGQVLDAGLKGSRMQIYRGFYDEKYVLIGSPVLRYTGIVTSYSLTEDRSFNDDNFALTVNCSSYKLILENRNAGRFTNEKSWKNFNSTDTSMDNVSNISNGFFNFGGGGQ
jgi:hypothetical protein